MLPTNRCPDSSPVSARSARSSGAARLASRAGAAIALAVTVTAAIAIPARAQSRAVAVEGPVKVLRAPIDAAVLPGWVIPTLGPAGAQWKDGRSTDGKMQILVEVGSGERGIAGRTETRFGVRTIRNGKPVGKLRIITLKGRFGFDAISNDGSRLFVTESQDHVTPGTYFVRMVDVASGELDPRVLDNRPRDTESLPLGETNGPELMYGTVITRLRLKDQPNWIFTLYDGAGRQPFVHALNTRGFALCVDLPKHGRDVKSIELFWQLSANSDTITVSNTKLAKSWSFAIGSEDFTESRL